MNAKLTDPGVQVVALVPVFGPVPPPISVVRPLLKAYRILIIITWNIIKKPLCIIEDK
jgi:hypothetical protein